MILKVFSPNPDNNPPLPLDVLLMPDLEPEEVKKMSWLISQFVEETSNHQDESMDNVINSIRLTMAMFQQWIIKRRRPTPPQGGNSA
jgi:hypothetical protein